MMKAVLIVLALIVILGVGFGFYRGWFNSSRNDEGNPSITVSVDKDKIEADKDEVVDKIAETTRKHQD